MAREPWIAVEEATVPQLWKSTEGDEAGKWDGEDVRRKFECFKRQCRQPGIPFKVGYLKETFFETLRGDRKKIFLASYLSAYDLGLVKEMARTLELDEKSIVQWTQRFRDVLVDYYTTDVTGIGGPNTAMQVDETHIVRRKYNVGRIVRRDWLVGGIQDGTKLVFVEITDDRSAANLDAIIQRHVIPGDVIRTDMWKGYSNLKNLGYIHETVNHSVNFVDPVTGVHTQRIENTWSHLKAKIRSRHRFKGELWDDHFHEVLWKWQFNSENLLYELWRQTAAKYTLS
ncbi:hypothetical protein ANCCAN_03643 [Ancylostoma caninum]|uniref:ISXO2-like transposase domain-containing protein n=1 Tax=Ancylostoma caninum TaxID=29170 RepID=A0A368H0V5_ANCCA|nr:hypothetical protein ANCCAN_03643 [Ancylostoma caninum]